MMNLLFLYLFIKDFGQLTFIYMLSWSFISLHLFQLLFKLFRPVEVAARGYAFVVSFSKTLSWHEVCNCGFSTFFLCKNYLYFIKTTFAKYSCLFILIFPLFSLQNVLPFCFREVWVITACLGLIKSTSSQYDGGAVAIDSEKEFYRLQGDLYSLCRVKASFNSPGVP
jgi:hypothetical protein